MSFVRPIPEDKDDLAHLNVFECRTCVVAYSVRASDAAEKHSQA